MKDTLARFIDAQNNLVVQHSDFSLRALHDMAASGSIDLAPHYQRRDRWSSEKQSALIESFILNVPVPPVYLSEDDFGRYSVIDGKQRITAIKAFLGGELRLKGLSKFHELEGCRFSDLPAQIQNALSVRPYIRVITLLKQTDPYLKFEVFLRLNTGGEKLRAQEIRNVAFSGQLNDLLIRLSRTPFLWRQMKIRNEKSTSYRSMEDVEHVLRYFTLASKWQNIGQGLADEMDAFMVRHREASGPELLALEKQFIYSIEGCEKIFGRHAFKKPQGAGWRDQFISPLFDAEMVAVSLLNPGQVQRVAARSDGVLQSLMDVYRDDLIFAKSVSQATNNPASVARRIQTVSGILANHSR
ncbi:MAG: DUF262 domain-containing protein [Opitutaceae bacterium]|nr:DUF262 domain-containing protein [Opitutaceae bacterium]